MRRKTLTIEVVPGSIVPSAIEVTGNSALPTTQLLDFVRTPDPLAAWLDPPSVERLLENHYRAEGFLAADVSVGRPESRNGTSVVAIQVVEGAPYSIGEVGVSGLPDEPELTARETLTLANGDRYRPASVAENVDRLEAGLRRAAYREAAIEVETRVDTAAARVDVAMVVTPGPRSILRDVVVQGGDASKPSVARSIVLTPDAPLDPAGHRRDAETPLRPRCLPERRYRRAAARHHGPAATNQRACSSSRSSPRLRSANGRAIESAMGWRSATRLSGRTSGIDGSASRPIWKTGTSSAAT